VVTHLSWGRIHWQVLVATALASDRWSARICVKLLRGAALHCMQAVSAANFLL